MSEDWLLSKITDLEKQIGSFYKPRLQHLETAVNSLDQAFKLKSQEADMLRRIQQYLLDVNRLYETWMKKNAPEQWAQLVAEYPFLVEEKTEDKEEVH